MRRGLRALALAAFVLVGAPSAQAADQDWVARALALQHELGGDVGMVNAPWVGTHNSFNSVAEMGPALSPLDSNQRIPITGQLDAGVRALELDLHWFPSARHLANRRPVVCHATGPHLGCSVEKTLDRVLDELRGWLLAHRGEVVMLYLEDHLDERRGYEEGARELRAGLPSMIYRPRGGGEQCRELPDALTRDRIRRSGRQVIIVGNCGVGPDWPGLVHAWSDHFEDQPTARYEGFPGCDPDLSRADYRGRLIRYYEDSTGLSRVVTGGASARERIGVATAGRLVRCGVDLIGLDQLTAEDPRLEALVWSWAPGEPGSGACSEQRLDGRWRARGCGGRVAAACSDGVRWTVSATKVPFAGAERACRRRDATFAVPRTGNEGQLLRAAMRHAGLGRVWLGQRRASGGRWLPLDRR